VFETSFLFLRWRFLADSNFNAT